MNIRIKKITGLGVVMLLALTLFSCKDLTEVNINHNGVSASEANPQFLTTTVLTQTAERYLGLGYESPFAGVMQYIQKTQFGDEDDNYQWDNRAWGGYYGLLRTNKKALELAEKRDRPFIKGISLVMKSFIFGLITDLWGDVPYSEALDGKNIKSPSYDEQKAIYLAVLSDLKMAKEIFEKIDPGSVSIGSADVYYQGDPAQWAKFANSLRLRYYMRISSRLPNVAKKGIEDIVSSGVLFKNNDDDATMDFIGTNERNDWPMNIEYADPSGANYRETRMCATFVNKLEALNDPRLAIWAEKIKTPIVIDANFSPKPDTIIGGVRYVHPDAKVLQGLSYTVDTDPDYVGIPPSILADPREYNINPSPSFAAYNPHVSRLADMYKEPAGALLKARLQSYAEVCFILSEAALKGWSVGKSAKEWYEDGVKASLNTWGVGNGYNSYISEPDVAYNGTLEQIITQKWIAAWTVAEEAWFDWRRTGYPDLHAGPIARQKVLPVRFIYPSKEYLLNKTNVDAALKGLEETNFSGAKGTDSPWSKMWVLQGTGEPW